MVRRILAAIGGGRDVSTEIDDRELVRLARSGDEDAFAELVRRHSGGMQRAVARIVNDREEAWDVVQMAFLKAWQRLDRYDDQWRFATWVYRIATNLAIDLIRSRASRERTHQASALHVVGDGGTPPEAEHRLAAGDVGRILAELVEELSPQQRSAFVLREMEGLETAEVAEVLGCSPATVRNHIFQARKVLKREIERRYPEYMPGTER